MTENERFLLTKRANEYKSQYDFFANERDKDTKNGRDSTNNNMKADYYWRQYQNTLGLLNIK